MSISHTVAVGEHQDQGRGAVAWPTRDLISKPMFWRPVYLGRSAWAEHLPFAFWLVDAIRPRSIVELGTHYGTSYFGFCQAVDRLGLATSCFAVDTWKGDEHAGFYGNEVYEQVKTHNDNLYSSFSRLVRSTFDEALDHFQEGSIDLLHIDGLHTEEAVLHDFRSWLPKMSARGVIIMHDTNVRERGFGVYRVFESIRASYPHFEFVHGHGLGVVAIGAEQAAPMRRLLDTQGSESERHEVQETFGRLGRACADALDLGNLSGQFKDLSDGYSRVSAQRDEANKALEAARADLQARAKELAELRKRLQEHIEHAAGEKGQFEERVRLLEEIRQDLRMEVERLREVAATKPAAESGADIAALMEQNETMRHQLEDRFHEISALTHMVEDLEHALQNKSNAATAESVRNLRAENQQLIERVGQAQAERDAQLARVHELLNSRSWKVTSPLRVFMNLLRTMFGR